MWRCLFLLLIACADKPTEPVHETTPPKVGPRAHVTKRAELPEALRGVVPKHGLYAAGGGLMSSPWRVVVDLDTNTIYGGASPDKPNGPSYGPLDKEHKRTLGSDDKAKLVALGNDAWAEEPPKAPSEPIADYDEILIVSDGDDTFYLEGYGPIRRPIAAKAIVALRAAAGL